MKITLALPAVAFALLSVASPSQAASPPKALWGKTITVSYTSSTPIVEHNGQYGSRNVVRTIYITTTGKILERVKQQTANASSSRDIEAGNQAWSFVGGKLVKHVFEMTSANLYEVSFNAGYQSCTFDGIQGHENGKVRTWKGVDGATYTAAGPAVFSAERCTVSAGNGL